MRRPATLLIMGAAIIAATMLAGIGQTSANPVPVSVAITDTGFSPSVVIVPPHSTVTWTNTGTQTLSIVGESGNTPESPDLAPRFTYAYTFHSAGTYAYHNASNAQLKGIVIVQEGAPAPGPGPNTPPPATSSPPEATLSPPQSSPVSPGQPEVLSDNPAGDGSSSFGGAEVSPPNTSLAERSASEIETEPASQPKSVSSAGEVSVELGNEWFGDPAFQSGVYETAVEPGGTIRWSVLEGIHNVYECGENWTKSGSCAAADWNSAQIITAGDTFSHTFASPGRFFYTCTIHPATMRGVVAVNAPSAPTASNPPPDSNPPSGSQPDPAPTDPQVVGIPQGGGPPLNPGDSRLIMILVGAAIAFVISTVTFVGGGARAKK